MPILTLEPDETLPDMPAPLAGETWLGPICLAERHPKNQFCFRNVELLPGRTAIFARDLSRETGGNWIMGEVRSASLMRAEIALPRTERGMRRWMRGRNLSRLFDLSGQIDEPPNRILLCEDGNGIWLDSSLGLELGARFEWDFDLAWLETDRLAVLDWLRRECADFDSPIRFARRWNVLDSPARHALVFSKDLALIQQMMRWASCCGSSIWTRDSVLRWRLRGNGDNDSWPFRVEDVYLCCNTAGHIKDLAAQFPLIHQISQFLLEQHIPKITRVESQKHLEARRLLESTFSWLGVDLMEPPTAHEQLEAALQLRAWLRQNAAPAALLALLRL